MNFEKPSLQKIPFKKIIQENDQFVLWILWILSLEYLSFFFVESILPGFIMNYLNLNFLLVFLLGGWLVYLKYSNQKNSIPKYLLILVKFFLLTIFILGLWFTLYNLASWEIATTFIFLSFI